MLRSTLPLSKMASTHSGMRRILKRRLPVPKYIEMAVKAGTYKTPSIRPNYLGLHDDPAKLAGLGVREREEQRVKLARGVLDYPEEYEILQLNPPLPMPPRTPVRVKKKIAAAERKRALEKKKERKKREILGIEEEEEEPTVLPGMDVLVNAYMRRHEDKLMDGGAAGASRREQEYYSQLLLGTKSAASDGNKKSASNTAMGRKSLLIENAYAFALRQQQVLLQGDVKGMRESAAKVEELLQEEARVNRAEGRDISTSLKSWRDSLDTDSNSEGGSSIPSIFHSKPRSVRALSLWAARLQSIPYHRWTVGATTALDHWIAREVLGMDENTWTLILEGGGADVSKLNILGGGESRRGLMDRMKDVVMAREALFPETRADATVEDDRELVGDLEDETNKSIDALLASLGSFDGDMDKEWSFDEDDDTKKADLEKEPIEKVMDELQVWRERNVSSAYGKWDADRKAEFDQWIQKYVSTLSPESTGQIDMEATRTSLLSQPPIDSAKSKDFWTKIRTEMEAEGFLQDYRSKAKDKLKSLDSTAMLTDEEKKLQSDLETLLFIPFDSQLSKLVDMGTLRPILDEYTEDTDRQNFFEKYSAILLEGLELEHLVPDPDGPIQLDDVGPSLREELSQMYSPMAVTGGDAEPRFSIQKIAYGTDEYGTSRAQRARDIYRMWNEHKANRARFEEAMFKKGFLGLKEDRVVNKK